MLKPYISVLIEEIKRSQRVNTNIGYYTTDELEKCSVAQLEAILEKIRKGL